MKQLKQNEDSRKAGDVKTYTTIDEFMADLTSL